MGPFGPFNPARVAAIVEKFCEKKMLPELGGS
jgi:hypothetical protein